VWRRIWEIAYPRPYEKIVARERIRSPIPEHLAYAIMREESAFRPRVVSSAQAYGLMQLIVPTARSMGRKLGIKVSREALRDPAVNIALGCRFLSILSKTFRDNPLLAILGYNAGPGAPRRWVKQRAVDDFDIFVETIPYRETRRYTKRVIRTMAAYATLYGKGMDGAWLQLPEHVVQRGGAGGTRGGRAGGTQGGRAGGTQGGS
jgi:soluble lytic murein transglycosylase